MNACYHTKIHFSDPVFPHLHGSDVGAMWEMLCTRGTDLTVEFGNIHATDTHGHADWVARYTFGTTNRRVVNRIRASFLFSDGLIVRHIDVFPLYSWSRQALGLPGVLLGWTPMFQSRVRSQAAASLRRWNDKR